MSPSESSMSCHKRLRAAPLRHPVCTRNVRRAWSRGLCCVLAKRSDNSWCVKTSRFRWTVATTCDHSYQTKKRNQKEDVVASNTICNTNRTVHMLADRPISLEYHQYLLSRMARIKRDLSEAKSNYHEDSKKIKEVCREHLLSYSHLIFRTYVSYSDGTPPHGPFHYIEDAIRQLDTPITQVIHNT